MSSKGLGYEVFGLKAGSYIQDGADTFNEYRALRNSGLSQEETVSILAKKAPMYILSAKADDYIGKSGKVDEVLYGKNGIVDKGYDYNYNKKKEPFLQNKLSYNINGEKCSYLNKQNLKQL